MTVNELNDDQLYVLKSWYMADLEYYGIEHGYSLVSDVSDDVIRKRYANTIFSESDFAY